MRNRFIIGLFSAAVLFATPVAASEVDNLSISSIQTDIEEIKSMIQRSYERQGIREESKSAEERIVPATVNMLESEPVIKVNSDSTLTNTTTPFVSNPPASSEVKSHTKTSSNTQAKASSQRTFQTPITTSVRIKSKVEQVSIPTSTSKTLQSQPSFTTSATSSATVKNPLQDLSQSQRSQQNADVRHSNRHRHQSASDEPPSKSNAMNQGEPTREQQLKHKGFMLFAADLAWNRVDESSDKSIRNPYSLGARLERGVLSPLAAIRVYAPDKLPEALAILAGQKEYT